MKSKRMTLAILLSLTIAMALLGSGPILAATADEQDLASAVPIGSSEPEQAFQLIIRTTDYNTTFQLPTSSRLNGINSVKPYNWLIDWGDGVIENRSGTSSPYGGIPHVYALPGDYSITIKPYGSTEAWMAAFGFYGTGQGSSSTSNKNLLIGAPSFITPQMTRTTAQIEGSEPAPEYEWGYTFYECTNLIEGPAFAGWEEVTTAGFYFASLMYTNCYRLTTLHTGFGFPQNLTTVGDGFACLMFANCISLTELPAGFNFPQNLTKAGYGFAIEMFIHCENLTTLPAGFNFPQHLTAVGDRFASSMFFYCKSLTTLPAGFNLPQNLTAVGDRFAGDLFYVCSSLTTLPTGFSFPQGLTQVGADFAYRMFDNCDSLTTLPAGFNLPQGLTAVGDNFALCLFNNCPSLAQLPISFNLPQELTEVGNFFVAQMFTNCTSLTTLPAGFNFPSKLTVAGHNFACDMFTNCTSLTALPAGFNLPQGLTQVGARFAWHLLNGAGSPEFQINDELRCPAGIPAACEDAFYQAFQLSDQAPFQNRSAASIIGDCTTPNTPRETFDSHFADIAYIPANWGGGRSPLIPGSGDLNGDGLVTMDEVVICAQVSIGYISLSPELLAVIDMDSDSYITMADVIIILKKTV